MELSDYSYWAQRAVKWSQNYLDNIRQRPVKSPCKPGDIYQQIDPVPPEDAVSMEQVFKDFEDIIPDGMTHWQHPRFFAYFPANASTASMIAEQLMTTMGAQCMLWQTSPAATELETKMVDWLRQSLGLPDGFSGVIQDSATSATLCAVLTMRERTLAWRGIQSGLSIEAPLRVYSSDQVHSSVDKAVRVSGIGQENLIKIATDEDYAMRADSLRQQIRDDRAAGYLPAGIVVCTGGTSIGASDNIKNVIEIAKAENLYVHVDAAWAGSAMICPEFRTIWDGVEDADSIVFNPHKWLGVQFDCSIQFLAKPEEQIKSVGIRPAYLETLEASDTIDYSEWTVPLGRRFRALKIWFMLRAYGLSSLRQRIRNHISWAEEAASRLAKVRHLEVTSDCRFSLFTFRYNDGKSDSDIQSAKLLERINADGRTYLTQTTHAGNFVIRFQVGHFDCTREDVMTAIDVVEELAGKI